MISLFDMLTLFAGSAAFGGALAAALTANGGGTEFAIAATLGVGSGIACTWLVHRAGRYVGRRTVREAVHPEDERRMRVLYAGAVLWIFAAGYLGNRIAAAVLLLFE